MPFKFLPTQEYWNNEQGELLIIGMYFGFFVMILIINLFYYFTFRDRLFLFYVFVLTSITASLFFSDGAVRWLIGSHPYIMPRLELLNRLILITTGCALFAHEYLQLSIFMPRVKKYTLIAIACFIPFLVAYLITFEFIYYIITEILVFAILTAYWVCGIMLYRKTLIAKFFVFAYALLLLVGLEYDIFRQLGVSIFGLSFQHLKIGGVVEMLLLSYAIVYRMWQLQKENDEM